MAVKSTNSDVPANRDYPYLGRWESGNSYQIVLFTNPKTGTLVAQNGNNGLGTHSTGWSESLYLPYKGTVTLSND